jgi:Domain of unknown function (DUF4123)
MNTEQLNQYLFSSATRVYAVLDGASVPDLRMKFYELNPPHFCLFSGDLEPDMQEVAPYLVRLLPKTPFTDWILQEGWGKHWGIFAHSREPVEEMRNHFRSLITVYDENGKPMIFRFYDPRVLGTFLSTCTAEELKVFFGKVEAYFAEADAADNLVRFQIGDGSLNETPLPVE